jgi:hypothetical protein
MKLNLIPATFDKQAFTKAEAEEGNLWIGTRAGLAVYREGGVILE